MDISSEIPGLQHPASSNGNGFDRKALAGHLLELARHLKPEVEQPAGLPAGDLRLEQLRTLLFGHEIALLSKLNDVVEDPEKLAAAVGRVLPTAIAGSTDDVRLSQVLEPALEKAIYPLIVPAIRKSIGERIDQTFQSLNESLKHSFTLRGLKWRLEAWRTGLRFSDVVLKHTLVYRVEHVFLIHRHTGLLISHVAAENAASQDPQIVSSMLGAIQDFVRDSFSGLDQQGLDTLRLGELRLWSEAGPFAMLVAVIRGNPPEELHETLRTALARIHSERPHALEAFDGDSTGFKDVEGQLSECVKLGQEAPRSGLPGLPLLVRLFVLLVLVGLGIWGFVWWRDQRQWEDYLVQLQSQPGIVITATRRQDGKFQVTGLRDPVAADPQKVLKESGIDPANVVTNFAPYQGLEPELVLKRLQTTLEPPPTVSLVIQGGRIVAKGSASERWLDRARTAERMLPAGSPAFDLGGVRNIDAEDQRQWDDYLARLRAEPGIVVTASGHQDGKFIVAGLRDPLANDPVKMLRDAGIDPVRVTSSWAPYQGLDPGFVLKRLKASLAPPETVTLAIEGNRIIARGSADTRWLDRAYIAQRLLPAGAPEFDLSGVLNVDQAALAKVRDAIAKLRDKIQAHTIYFDFGVPLPASGQDGVLDQIASELRELSSLSSPLLRTKVTLTGNSDAAGEGTFNLALSVARSEAVRALLQKRGVSPDLLAVRGAGTLEPAQPGDSQAAHSANRRVWFSVSIQEQP